MSNPYPLYIYEIQAGRLPGWGYEPVRITIPAHTFDEVFEDLPVDLRISADSGANHADLSHIFATMESDDNRKRICVTAGDGITPCSVEIKEWNTATPTATLTVTVPLVNPGEDTHLYLYYDPEHAEMTDWVTDAPAPPDDAWAYIYPIAYAATDVADYQQDVVIHRSEGASYEETVGDLKVWHVYVGDRCKSDYGDIRFTDAAGNALAYYLWPDYDSSSARFCVRLEGADAAGDLLVWYGNPSATTTSDGSATYEFFNDGSSLEGFTTLGTVAVEDGRIYLNSASAQILTTAEFGTNITVEYSIQNSASNRILSGLYSDDFSMQQWFWDNHRYLFRSFLNGVQVDSDEDSNAYTSNPLACRITRIGDISVKAEISGGDTFIQSSLGADPCAFAVNLDSYNFGKTYVWDVRVRTYSTAPPAATAFGPEQEVVTPSDVYLVYDAAPAPLTLAGYADAYDYLSWTRRYRRPGAWKAQINRYLPAAKEFVPGRLVHFRRNGEDRLGLIETRQISVDTSGRPSEQWTVAGREIIGILGDRLCLHGVSTGTGYDEFAGAAESALRHYVDANAINPDDARRIVPFLALSPTDDGRGGTTKQSARFDVLTDLLESICAASGLGYRGRWSWDDRRLYFEVVQGADRSGSVKLSPALGNCTIKGYNESTGLAPSVAVVAGQGEAAARVVVDVGTGGGLIGLARRERFIDARDLATEAELQQRGAEKLAEDGDTTTLEVEYIRTASYRYGEDFDLGDIVHVEYPDIATMDARIVAITEEYAREGERLTLTLGTEWPDLVSLLRAQRKDNVEKRV